MSSFWSIWITVITLGSLIGCWWLLFATRKGEPSQDDQISSTGHTFDGIEEYDNPLPRWWFYLFIVTIIFAAVYLALYPGLGNYKGYFGWTQESAWEQEQNSAAEKYDPIVDAYAQQSIEELQSNQKALLSGQRVFANNCSICHGSAATGSRGFPNLTDADWLYGSDPDAIKTSIMHGRNGQMPPWGAVLGADGVEATAAYILSLSGRETDASKATAGKAHYSTTCIACHGMDGKGNTSMGAPNLTDNTWLYGGSIEDIKESIRSGRKGQMPAHKELLGEAKVHLLAAYVYSLSGKN